MTAPHPRALAVGRAGAGNPYPYLYDADKKAHAPILAAGTSRLGVAETFQEIALRYNAHALCVTAIAAALGEDKTGPETRRLLRDALKAASGSP